MKKKTDRKKQNRSAWKNEYLFRSYDLARSGTSDAGISKILGVDPETIAKWRDEIPQFAEALRAGRSVTSDQSKSGALEFQEYVYRRLPENLQVLWDEIRSCEREPNGVKKIEALLQKAGLRARQHLYIHSLVSSHFNNSKACRRLNVSVSTLNNWIQRDPDFRTLMEEIHWHKKNYFEDALMNLVRQGDARAIVMVNQSVNRDRGYGQKVEVHKTGKVDHNHTMSVDDLELPIEVRKAMLKAIRDRQDQDRPLELGPRIAHPEEMS